MANIDSVLDSLQGKEYVLAEHMWIREDQVGYYVRASKRMTLDEASKRLREIRQTQPNMIAMKWDDSRIS